MDRMGRMKELPPNPEPVGYLVFVLSKRAIRLTAIAALGGILGI
jgi:hypothetical protein